VGAKKVFKVNGVTGMTSQESPSNKREQVRWGSIRKDVNYALLFLDVVIFVSISTLVLWGFIDPTIYEGSRSLTAPIIVSFFWIPIVLIPSGYDAWRRWKMRQDPHKRRSSGASIDVHSSGGGGFYDL
jgi:hypothetical protein